MQFFGRCYCFLGVIRSIVPVLVALCENNRRVERRNKVKINTAAKQQQNLNPHSLSSTLTGLGISYKRHFEFQSHVKTKHQLLIQLKHK